MTARTMTRLTHTEQQWQARMIEATAADVESVRGIRDMYRDAGWTERAAEAGGRLAVAQQDHEAAVASRLPGPCRDGPGVRHDRPGPGCGYPDRRPGNDTAPGRRAVRGRVRGYVADCLRLRAQLDPAYHPTANGAVKLIPHSGDAEEAERSGRPSPP